MPGLIVPPGYANVKLRWTLTGDMEQMCCTLGVSLESGVSDPSVVAGEIGNCWAHSWGAANTIDFYHFDGCWAQIGQDGGNGPIAESTDGAYQGTMSAASPPQNVALLIRKLTAVGGHKNRGRMYLPPFFGEGGVDQLGRIESASYSALTSRLNQFWTDLTEKTTGSLHVYGPVIFHNDYGAQTPDPTPITSFYVDPVVATQRRRLRR